MGKIAESKGAPFPTPDEVKATLQEKMEPLVEQFRSIVINHLETDPEGRLDVTRIKPIVKDIVKKEAERFGWSVGVYENYPYSEAGSGPTKYWEFSPAKPISQ